MDQFSQKRIFQQIAVALETKFHQSTPQCNTMDNGAPSVWVEYPVFEWSHDLSLLCLYFYNSRKKFNRKVISFTTIKVISFTTMALALEHIFFCFQAACICHLPCILLPFSVVFPLSMYLLYSIVKDSNADLTVGNWESKIDP